MNPKDRSMICRMAGNIVGHIYTHSADTSANEDAENAVVLAIAIVEIVDLHIKHQESSGEAK